MAIWVKYSQKWIKLYNIFFTPTARHNDRLYLISTAENQILERQKYLTSHLWLFSSWAKLNVLLLDQKPLRINSWVNTAFFFLLVFFFFSSYNFYFQLQLCASLSLSLSSSSCLFTHTPLCWTLFWLSVPCKCAGCGLPSLSSSEKKKQKKTCT